MKIASELNIQISLVTIKYLKSEREKIIKFVKTSEDKSEQKILEEKLRLIERKIVRESDTLAYLVEKYMKLIEQQQVKI